MPECQLISKVVYDPAQLKGGLEIVYKPSKKDGFAKFLTDPFAGYELRFKFISTYWIWKTKPYSCRGTGCTYMSGITQMVLPALFGFASAFNLHFLRSSLSFEPFISYFWKNCEFVKSRYESLSDVGESRVWFASKNLTPCRIHWNAFLIAQIIAKCHSFPNMYGML